jgi:hypothetical protein
MRARAVSTPPTSPPVWMVRPGAVPSVASSVAIPGTAAGTAAATMAPAESSNHAAFRAILKAQARLEEAQRRHAHDAGVFVGNLSWRLTHLELLHELQRCFSWYGRCEVGIKATPTVNGRAKPWAIVQFEVCLQSLTLASLD